MDDDDDGDDDESLPQQIRLGTLRQVVAAAAASVADTIEFYLPGTLQCINRLDEPQVRCGVGSCSLMSPSARADTGGPQTNGIAAAF